MGRKEAAVFFSRTRPTPALEVHILSKSKVYLVRGSQCASVKYLELLWLEGLYVRILPYRSLSTTDTTSELLALRSYDIMVCCADHVKNEI